MTGRIPRISNVQLDADVQTIRALKGIPDYKPHNPEFSAEAAEAAVERMEATATAVLLAENALAAARTESLLARANVHGVAIGVKDEVTVIYGSDSDQIAAIRRELCRALVGWTPPGASDSLIYEGRSFLHTDRAKAAYAFSFSAFEILGHDTLPATADEAETWQALDLIGLPPLEGVDVDVDLIDPIVDKNLKPDGVGPDGRIEHRLKKDFT